MNADVFKLLRGKPMAIHGPALDAMLAAASLGHRKPAAPVAPRRYAAIPGRGVASSAAGSVAVLPLVGFLDQRQSLLLDLFGGTSLDAFGRQLDSLVASASVKAVVIDCDSPGGSVYGCEILADKIRRANDKKPVVTVANSLCASAAFWTAGQAGTIAVVPGGEIGSIGAVAVHTDLSNTTDGVRYTVLRSTQSPNKFNGSPYEGLSNSARAEIQKSLDGYAGQFVADVAKARRVSTATVLSRFGGGRVMPAAEAVTAGLADSVATLDSVLAAALGSGKTTSPVSSRATNIRFRMAAAKRIRERNDADAERRQATLARLDRQIAATNAKLSRP